MHTLMLAVTALYYEYSGLPITETLARKPSITKRSRKIFKLEEFIIYLYIKNCTTFIIN